MPSAVGFVYSAGSTWPRFNAGMLHRYKLCCNAIYRRSSSRQTFQAKIEIREGSKGFSLRGAFSLMPDFLASDLELHLHQMGFGVVQCTAGPRRRGGPRVACNVQGTGSFVRNLLDLMSCSFG